MTGDRSISNASIYLTLSRFLPFSGAIADILIRLYESGLIALILFKLLSHSEGLIEFRDFDLIDAIDCVTPPFILLNKGFI